MTMTELREFRIDVPDEELSYLADRLARVRMGPELGEGYGVPVERVRELVEYWRDRYDWRVWEARLNAYPQYTTTIDGTTVHFLHVRSGVPGAIPLILTHGWPGSVVEFLDLIEPLTDPAAPITFDLVIPSLPGFGWSGPTPDAGWGPRRIARAWATLMRGLGYDRYAAAGNDWGSPISIELSKIAPVIGIHLTQLFSLPDGESMSYPPTDQEEPSDLSPADRAALAGLRDVQHTVAAYAHVHEQQPQTLAYALYDSPLALLAWNSQVMGGLDPETLLTHVSIHWLTGTAGSALRIYADSKNEPTNPEPTRVPVGLAEFAEDLHTVKRYAERDHSNIVSWNTYDTGGHYAAHQATDLVVEDLRAFFSRVHQELGRGSGAPSAAPHDRASHSR